ncbi:hypothetical protein ASF08_22830 [Methylobacterium sp. Leaf85]|nr:hypothetical protein ASF08_22830 [Methylobacterium sp. Leaf85]
MFRLNEARKDQLMQAAEAAGRSMSEEIERRVEESFRAKEVAKAASMRTIDALEMSFGSSEIMDISMSLAYALHQALGRQKATVKDFMDDPEKRQAIITDYAEALPHFIDFLARNTTLGTGKFRELIAMQFDDTTQADGLSPQGD